MNVHAKWRYGLWLWMLAVPCILFGGCLPEVPEQEEPVVPEPDGMSAEYKALQKEMIAQWLDFVEHPVPDQMDTRPYFIATEVAKIGPTALSPLLEVLGQDSRTPETKVAVVASTSHLMTTAYVPYLLPHTEVGLDETTRACATMLLAMIDDPEVNTTLETLVDDEERRVMLAATLGLAKHGKDSARARLRAMHGDVETTNEERSQIYVTLSVEPTTDDIAILLEAVRRKDLNPFTRVDIVTGLGRVGDASIIDSLRQSKTEINDNLYRSTVDTVIEAILEREENAPVGEDSAE